MGTGNTSSRIDKAGHPLWHVPLVIVLSFGAVAVGVVSYHSVDSTGQQAVRENVSEAAWTFLLVGVLSLFIKVLVERHQTEAAKAELLDDYRRGVIDRVATLTYRVREAGSIVQADRSAQVYDEQMRAVLRSHSELGQLLHELDTIATARPEVFGDWPTIKTAIENMKAWLAKLIDEWRTNASVKALLEEVAYEGKNRAGKTSTFEEEYLNPYHQASELMRNDLVRRRRT